MIERLLIYTLAAACLLWFGAAVVRPGKSAAQWLLCVIMFVVFVSFYSDAAFCDDFSDGRVLVALDAVSQFLTPTVVPLLLMLLWIECGQKVRLAWLLGWFALPMMLGVISLLLYMLVGFGDSVTLLPYVNSGLALPAGLDSDICLAHVFVAGKLFYVVVGLEMLYLLVVLMVSICRRGASLQEFLSFMSGRSLVQRQHVLLWLLWLVSVLLIIRCCASVVGVGYDWVLAVLAALLTVVISACCHLVLNVAAERLSLPDLVRSGAEPQAPAIEQPEEELEPEPDIAPVPIVKEASQLNAAGLGMDGRDYVQLVRRFNDYLIGQRNYLREDITLNHVVQALGVNRSYLSYLANREYGMPFRELVGKLRIDYAMQYMRQHPGCLQDVVAAESGFSCASTFNRKFNQVVGMTPRLWLTRYAGQAPTAEAENNE